MTTNMFLILLFAFSAVTGLVTEGIKKITTDRVHLSYNIVALITALITGGGGTAVYYQLNALPFTVNNTIYLVLLSLASGLTSMVGYDKVRQLVLQITGKKES